MKGPGTHFQAFSRRNFADTPARPPPYESIAFGAYIRCRDRPFGAALESVNAWYVAHRPWPSSNVSYDPVTVEPKTPLVLTTSPPPTVPSNRLSLAILTATASALKALSAR